MCGFHFKYAWNFFDVLCNGFETRLGLGERPFGGMGVRVENHAICRGLALYLCFLMRGMIVF